MLDDVTDVLRDMFVQAVKNLCLALAFNPLGEDAGRAGACSRFPVKDVMQRGTQRLSDLFAKVHLFLRIVTCADTVQADES